MNMEPSGSAPLIPPGVRVVADLHAGRPPVPHLPESERYVAWSPDGRYLLYIGGLGPRGEEGPLMLLDTRDPRNPSPVAPRPFYGGLAWHPDGQSFVYMGRVQGPGERSQATIYRQRLAGGEPVNLLPPEVTPPLNLGFIHRWLDDRTLAFDESVGTAMRRVLILDAAKHAILSNPELVATMFEWAPAGNRLAGQSARPLPTMFWLWDRSQDQFLPSPVPEEQPSPPGPQRFFEAWSPDGRFALFTAWSGEPYDTGSRPALYRLNLETGQTSLLSEAPAAFAAWSGDWIAYVRYAPRLTLVMTRASDGEVLWTDDLGALPNMDEGAFPWTYWPRMAGAYVVYRTTSGDWRVSRTDRKEVRRIYRGESVNPYWSADGKHIALLHTNESAVLTVLENPLWQPATESIRTAVGNPAATLPAQQGLEERIPGPPLDQPPPPDPTGLPTWLRQPPAPWLTPPPAGPAWPGQPLPPAPPVWPGPMMPPSPPVPESALEASVHPWIRPRGRWVVRFVPVYWPWWG